MEKNIIDVFNGFSETQPDKIACIYKNTTLTYAELDKFSDILANSILQQKIASGSKIAVILPRSHHILISILAIHKTGCVYVPIDPEFPKHRIASILTEVEPCKIISSSSIKDTLDKDQTLYIDITSINFNIDEGKTFFSKLDNHTYSHIFFTSGTTGKPKGVVSTHKNLIHYLSSAKNQFKFNSNDIFISVARFTFSISLFELLLPLYVGGQVKIIPTDDIFNLKQLAHHIQNATVFHFGPSLMKILLPYIQENYHNCSAFKGVKHVSSGGDMVPIEIIRSLNLTFASAEVYVIYGSSEINCMGCYYFADRQSAEIKRSVGRTFDNVSLKILDDNLAELPMGTVGNIYFSGKGLATGYLNQAELSNNLFIIIEGVRYYNIGDIGKLDADSDLELHGRNDFQVQIKGMRVELFEVENQLKKQANIVDCVISSDKNGPSYENRLIAYVVLDNNINANSMQFKKYLSQYLPDYMIPSIYIKLTNLPLNFNGKIDRKSLPSPIENQIKNTVYKEATNAIELELISIFKQLFKSQTIGIEDDFFDLGGDSLMAVNLLISIENKYQKHIPISQLVQSSSIKEIARLIENNNRKIINNVVVLKEGDQSSPLFCLYGIFLYKELVKNIKTDKMICAVYLQEEIEITHHGIDSKEFSEYATVENIAEKYYQSIKSFHPHGPYNICGNSFGGIIAIEVAKKFMENNEVVNIVILFDTWTPEFQQQTINMSRLKAHFKEVKKNGVKYIIKKISKKVKPDKIEKSSGDSAIDEWNDMRKEIRHKASIEFKPTKFALRTLLFKPKIRSIFEPDLKYLGWGQYIENITSYDCDGDHMGIFKKGNVEYISAIITKELKN